MTQPKLYSLAEERFNIGSHALGVLLSLGGIWLLVSRAIFHGNGWHLVSFTIYGCCLFTLYLASTVYHGTRDPDRRRRMRTVDHASIFLLIAGTYTPFALVTLNGAVGWTIFGITWGMAVTGIVLKLFFTGRFEPLSVAIYVLMGWLIILFIKPLMQSLSGPGLAWLVAGGVAYTVGAAFYGFIRVRFNHAVFHVFVLVGSLCHFMAVYRHVLPLE